MSYSPFVERANESSKMNDTKANKKEKNQHIQVFVRVRPTNNTERYGKSVTVVDVPTNKDVVIKERPQDKLSKKFTFDKVFGPNSKQVDVYKAVVNPLLEEVLAGYNCTVFAYGQTGTGKTFTMEGFSNDPSLHWQSDTSAGIIPRALSHLFDELRLLDGQEFTVRVSFLELYNEELFDLLSPNDDASKIRLYEDASKKGAVIIHGLEEVTVHNKSEVYKILEKGSEKRQTAATLMNANSSRSHTVFSITVHIKENTVDGEELLKTGKLNLVDLAGSENVGRSGAVDRRAREAGNINQSLLTLGRVITALVERAPHIPYRESKLTRLLQESLGGRTKTSIIATVSPASMNLEETLSTLDYAHRAKNITNRPEINQKLSKKALLKEYTEEIERLRRDLLATRERNGVYLAQENYNEMQAQIDCQGKEIEEKINHIKALEEEMQKKEELFNDLQSMYVAQSNDLNKTKLHLQSTKITLDTTMHRLKTTEQDRDEQKHLVEKHASTEKVLSSQAHTLLNVADTASTDTHKLHEKIVRKKTVEEANETVGQQFKGDMEKRVENIENDLSNYTKGITQFCCAMKEKLGAQMNLRNSGIDEAIRHIANDLVGKEHAIADDLVNHTDEIHSQYHNLISEHMKEISCTSERESETLHRFSATLAPKLCKYFEREMAEHLQKLNERTARKVDDLLDYVTKTTDRLCDNLLTDRDVLCKDLTELKKNIEIIRSKQNDNEQQRQEFEKVFEDLYARFKNTCDGQKANHGEISIALNKMTEVCSSRTDKAASSCEKNLHEKNDFKENVQKDVAAVKKDVSSSVEQSIAMGAEAMKHRDTVLVELQTGLNACCDTWLECRAHVEQNMQELKEKIREDKDAIQKTAEDLRNTISAASAHHVSLMEAQKSKTAVSTAEMSTECERLDAVSVEWDEKIVTRLHDARQQVNKFLQDDLRRDVPTGGTPARREFQYPRKLAATSPHERIIQRFREARKNVVNSEGEEPLETSDVTLIEDITYCAAVNIPGGNPSPDNSRRIYSTSTPNTAVKGKESLSNDSVCNIVKSASTSDLSIIARPSLELATRSETDLFLKNENKENGTSDEFAKPGNRAVKRLSKIKAVNRRVLGSFN